MYWLSFVMLSLVLYLPPFNLAEKLWRWFTHWRWYIPLFGWPCSPWQAYLFWLSMAYLTLGTLLHFIHRRWPVDSPLGRLVCQVSQARLGGLEVFMAGLAAAVLVLAGYILPIGHILYGWTVTLSAPVAALSVLYLLAEALRLVEVNIWADRAFAGRRGHWLFEQGYYSGGGEE